MIRFIVEIDIDDSQKIGCWNRHIKVHLPKGYSASKVECTGWGRDLETGSVDFGVGFCVKSPPDILPRVSIYGDKR